jgi:uncharacterized protein YjbI with pentapeptide repeats
MNDSARWVLLDPLDAMSCAAFLVEREDGEHVIVVAKASFSMAEDGDDMVLVEPEAILRRDFHHGGNPFRGVRATSDLVPFLPLADVVLTGHAQPVGGRPVAQMRVALRVRDGRSDAPLIDKELTVRGEPGEEELEPFTRVPIVYERAYGGPGVLGNPFGVGASEGSPQILDPDEPRRPAGFNPLARAAPIRKALLRDEVYRNLRATPPRIPDDIDWGYFQSAPPDQRMRYLDGSEMIILEGLHASAARIARRLPALRAVAHVWSPTEGAPRPLPLVADTLRIDADALRCTVVFRGSFPLLSEAHTVQIATALEGPGHAPRWPDWLPSDGVDEVPAAKSALDALSSTLALPATKAEPRLDQTVVMAPESEEPMDLEGTQLLSGAEPTSSALPFQPGTPQPAPPSREDEAESWGTGTVALTDGDVARAGGSAATPFAKTQSEKAKGHELAPLSQVPAARFFHVLERFEPPSETPSEAPEPTLPNERDGERVPCLSADPMVLVAMPWQIAPPQNALIVTAKATFTLEPDAPATLCEDPAPLSGDVHVEDAPEGTLLYASDFSLPKPRVDVLLTGHAHAPNDGATAMVARFRFGADEAGFVREIAVVGDRRWAGSVAKASDPAPFERVPLIYERAFGGPGYESNPVGCGLDRREDRRMPNLEDRKQPLVSPRDRPQPMSFAGIPASWKARGDKLGTYDRDWVRTRWPYYARDLDPTYFHAAPEEQRVAKVCGDEAFELVGMHPEHATLRGSLPGMHVRCFAQPSGAPLGALEPVSMRIDTVSFDVDAMLLHIVWRGTIDVKAETAPELAAVFGVIEPIHGPALADATVRERFLAVLPARIRAAIADGELPRPLGAAAPRSVPGEVGTPPEDDPAREALLARVADGEALDGEDLRGTDLRLADLGGASLRGADLRGVALGGAMLDGAHLDDADLQEADLRGASLVGAHLGGADLAGARLTGAVLREARGDRASFVGADCTEALFVSAELSRADLTETSLDRACFDDAKLERVRLAGARGEATSFLRAGLAGARARGARLTGGKLDGATGPGSKWQSAHLESASFVGAQLDGATFTKATCRRASFAGASLCDAKMRKTVLEGADLHGANLMHAVLEGAGLENANLRGANLYEAALHQARLEGADLEDAITTRTWLELGS